MFTLEDVKNLIWENAEHTLFSCQAKFTEIGDFMPISADANDPYPHIQNLWQKATSGEFGQIAEFIPTNIATKPQPEATGVQTL